MAFAVVVALAAIVVIWKWRQSGRPIFEFLALWGVRVYVHLWHRILARPARPLPTEGPVLLVCNHTCSADGALLQAVFDRPVVWLMSREHYEIHSLVRKVLNAANCVPVRRTGRDVSAARTGLKRLRDGLVVGVFPEGNLSGVTRGRLKTPKAGAAWMALRSGAPVLPIWISGGPQTNRILAAWLVPSRQPVRVAIGKPVDLSRFQGKRITRKLLEEVSECLMGEICKLGGR